MIKKMFEDDRYNDNDPPAKRVRTVAHKLITSNQDLGNVGDWEIHVIKNENRNAFVLPSGHIFVFSGLLKVANNENQLAIVLGHEMSHAVLDHGAESMSMRNFTDDIFIVCLFFIWCMSPSYLKGVALSWFCHSLFDFLLKPLSRMQETEADKVGMMFASRACYDYREGAVFWEKIAKIESALENFTIPEWLGTHPDSSKRAKQMNSLEDKAVDWRKENALCVPAHVKEVKK
ncbi:unnamed protein product [Lymnaea stagnalis]|uniref:Metalloendopeptidase OMA1, mitochondrial n=1 Tax=Lymnaea stagnalis TaxID=6523 RepID=A0AAV2IN49_LYMST